jgi:hypothetical protein
MISPDKVYHSLPKGEEDQHIEFLTYRDVSIPYSECSCNPILELCGDRVKVHHFPFRESWAVKLTNEILNNNV